VWLGEAIAQFPYPSKLIEQTIYLTLVSLNMIDGNADNPFRTGDGQCCHGHFPNGKPTANLIQ